MPVSTTERGQDPLNIWDENATVWDEGIGRDGNKYWRRLQEPCLRRLLAPQLEDKKAPSRALELACGNGIGSRWLASHGESIHSILATDGSQGMVERAKMHGSGSDKISFRTLDVTSLEDFVRLSDQTSEAGFDIVLMNMALMDLPDLGPLAKALPALLSNRGVFVATLLHPVFMTSTYTRNVQYKFNPETGKQTVEKSKAIIEYLQVEPAKQIVAPGQETPMIYFHRPIHELLSPFFKAGLVMDALEEPSFTTEDAIPERPEATSNYVQLPPIMAIRLRKLA